MSSGRSHCEVQDWEEAGGGQNDEGQASGGESDRVTVCR